MTSIFQFGCRFLWYSKPLYQHVVYIVDGYSFQERRDWRRYACRVCDEVFASWNFVPKKVIFLFK